MNVSSQPIAFIDKYPVMTYNGKNIDSDKFKREYDKWNTVYLEGLTKVTGYGDFNDKKLAFIGNGQNDNMIFIGFNLLYHELETQDNEVSKLLNEILDSNEEALPKKELVPLDINYNGNKIKIDSPVDGLNTTIAFQDNFKSKQELNRSNNLLVVNKGETEIDIFYSHFKEGAMVSILGLLGVCVLIYYIYIDKKHNKNVGEI